MNDFFATTTQNANGVRNPARHPGQQNATRIQFGVGALIVTVAGGLTTGVALATLIARLVAPSTVELQLVASTDIDAAAPSLLASDMVSVVKDAKSCRRPLAFVTVAATGNTAGGLRFRSGNYVSPNVKLSRNPFRIALPLPAPLEAGAGQITVMSDGRGGVTFLRPGVVIPLGTLQQTIDVSWEPKLSCTTSK